MKKLRSKENQKRKMELKKKRQASTLWTARNFWLEPGPSGTRTFRPTRSFRPPTSSTSPGVPTLWLARNLPGTCPRPSGPRNLRPAQTFRPPDASLAPPASTLWLGRTLPEPSVARNIRPRPELPACLCAEKGASTHVSPTYPLDYKYSFPSSELGLAKCMRLSIGEDP